MRFWGIGPPRTRRGSPVRDSGISWGLAVNPASRVKAPCARIVREGRSIVLPAGDYLIGRAPSCTVVLDERSVSRRHARLRISQHGVSIEDLESANGVYVNGIRIAEPKPLEDGDIVIIGDEELKIHPELPSLPRAQLEAPCESPGWPDAEPGSGLSLVLPTERINALLVVAPLAERALDAGAPTQAEQILRPRLLEMLREIERVPESVNADAIDRALTLALALAQALPSRDWLEYVIELLTAISKPCSYELALSLQRAKQQLGPLDAQRLHTYATAIRALTSSVHTVRTLTLIDDLKA